MSFVDKLLTCQQCGAQFVFTVTEQRALAERGITDFEPQFCPTCREQVQEGIKVKYIGQVKWFNRRKGYGFIIQADGSEIFVHRTGIARGVRGLRDGQQVEYEIEQTAKGPQAVNVAPLPK